MNRDQLQNDYIERIIDGMDHKDLWAFVYDALEQNFERYSVNELITEVEDYYPDLLEDWCHKPVGCPTSWQGVTQNGHRGGNRVL